MHRKVQKNGVEIGIVRICKLCGNESLQKLLFKHKSTDTLEDIVIGTFDVDVEFNLVEFETCQGVSLYLDAPFVFTSEPYGDLLYPVQKDFSDYVPDGIKKIYAEASRILLSLLMLLLAR